jgi:hypothetical protein
MPDIVITLLTIFGWIAVIIGAVLLSPTKPSWRGHCLGQGWSP